MEKDEQINIKSIQLSKIWKFAIVVSLLGSMFSVGVDFNLIKIDKMCFWCKDDTKSITDNSVTYNSSSDFIVKNLIDSNASVSYTKTTQVLSDRFTKTLSIINNDKVNYHYLIVHDIVRNTIFLKDYPYNKTITYAECNDEYTNCAIYTQFMLENNKNYPACFEKESPYMVWGASQSELKKLPYFYQNPKDCLDYNNISP
ncbi:MAG: hypothetical protein O8C62_06455 [Candidatus Methanoperedens sp.]|nr:hypothetical protein [Candidatus Methanoperedens sp.]